VAALEAHLAVRLFQRSTRSLTLTEDGRDLLGHARLVVEAVEETEAAIGRRRSSPSGTVRIGSPGVFGRLYIAPRLHRLLDRYPELSVDLSLSDTVVDVVQEGLDLSIRIGEVTEAGLVARRIGATRAVTLASVEYLEKHGEPAHPLELSQHECIIFTRRASPDIWHFRGTDGEIAVAVHGRLRCDGLEAVLEAAITGVGVALLPLWMMREQHHTGLLRQILQPWRPPLRAISVVYPSRRFLAPRTRAMIDFLADEFRNDPMISPLNATLTQD
jgi:DNA-binding transcriptional LysR family regulator